MGRVNAPTALVARHDELKALLKEHTPHVLVESPLGTVIVETSKDEAHRMLTLLHNTPGGAQGVMLSVSKITADKVVVSYLKVGNPFEFLARMLELPPRGVQSTH